MVKRTEEWITVRQAADILTVNSDHEISDSYVRLLGKNNKIEFKQLDGRTKLYSKHDIEQYIVRKRGDGSIRRKARAKRVSTSF